MNVAVAAWWSMTHARCAMAPAEAKSTKTMQVPVPAGVTDGQRIGSKGRGGAGENGGAAGDLYVTVHVRAHPIFGRKGDNLTLTAPVTFQRPLSGRRSSAHTGWTAGPSCGCRQERPTGTPFGYAARASGSATARRATPWSLSRCWCPRRSTNERERLWRLAEVVGTVNPRGRSSSPRDEVRRVCTRAAAADRS